MEQTHINHQKRDWAAPEELQSDYLRLLVDPLASGANNMAVDEALLESTGFENSRPVFRLYGFGPGTLSVGRFQRTDGVIDFGRLREDRIDFVRRPSGGKAVLHGDEVTYACFLSRHHLEEFGKRAAYRFIIGILMSALEGLAVSGLHPVDSGRGSAYDPDCFASAGEYEIDDSHMRKLVGSAQMIIRSGVLQHGSIPLGNGNRRIRRYIVGDDGGHGEETGRMDPTSISELLGRHADFATIRDELVRSICDVLPARRDTLTTEERRRAEELVSSKYTQDSWNRKR